MLYCGKEGCYIENCDTINNSVFDEQPEFLTETEDGSLFCNKCWSEVEGDFTEEDAIQLGGKHYGKVAEGCRG